LELRVGSDLVGLDLEADIKLQKATKSWGLPKIFCSNEYIAYKGEINKNQLREMGNCQWGLIKELLIQIKANKK